MVHEIVILIPVLLHWHLKIYYLIQRKNAVGFHAVSTALSYERGNNEMPRVQSKTGLSDRPILSLLHSGR